jgi:hypothetical protein
VLDAKAVFIDDNDFPKVGCATKASTDASAKNDKAALFRNIMLAVILWTVLYCESVIDDGMQRSEWSERLVCW